MVEITSGGSSARTTGLFRRQLLEDSQKQLFVAVETGKISCAITAQLHLKSFLNTIDKNGEPYKIIQGEVEKIEKETSERIRQFKVEQSSRDSLLRFDHQADEINIYIEDVGSKFQLCWDVSEKFGLFND